MKKILSVALLLAGGSLFAAEAKPLIVKSSGGGHMHPEYGGAETCQVFKNKVVITHVMGFQGPTALRLTEERKINLEGNVQLVAEKAATEEVIQRENNMCDGPHTGISAIGANGEQVVLFSTGGCGTKSTERVGLASHKLRNIADQYCPTTYTGGIEP